MGRDYKYTGIEGANDIVQEILLTPSTLETIDTAMFTHLDDHFALSTKTNKGFKKTPLLWLSAERAHQVKNNPEIRDDASDLIYPLMTLSRTGVEKDPNFKGAFQAHFFDGPGQVPNDPRRVNVPIARRVLQGKTSDFANATARRKFGPGRTIGSGDPNRKRKNKKVVYQTVYAPLPTYIKVNYNLKIVTDHLQQMNHLTTPFLTRTGQINTFFIEAEGHRYEVFIEGNFGTDNNFNNLGEELRTFSTDINFRVLGYLMGDGPNDERPKFSVVENYVEVKMPRETVITGDINELTRKSFYRE
jgi:hypothetical protein